MNVCAGFRPGSILPRVVPFTISLSQVQKLHVMRLASFQAGPLTSVAPAAKRMVSGSHGMLGCEAVGHQAVPCLQLRQALAAPVQTNMCCNASHADADKLCCKSQSAADSPAMAAAHLCCSLLLPPSPLPWSKSANDLYLEAEQLIAWVHALVPFITHARLILSRFSICGMLADGWRHSSCCRHQPSRFCRSQSHWWHADPLAGMATPAH